MDTVEPTVGHTHAYVLPDHTHEHSRWRRWSPVLAVLLLLGAAAYGVWRVEETSNQNDRQLAQQTAAIVHQSEANCRARDAQLRNQAASNATGRRFFVDLAQRLEEDGNLTAATYIRTELKKIPPLKPPPKANCDFPDTEIPG